ncbi:MAG: hypothetical protein KBD78_04735 [Oligoflexales bacterium]|nr:hypothetical protein [Oligoflexales bacterium]
MLCSSRIFIFLLTLSTIHIACSDDEERFEQISKLRTLGVKSNKVASAPSTVSTEETVSLEIVVSFPNGVINELSAVPFVEENSSTLALPVLLELSETAISEESFGPLTIATITANLKVPTFDFSNAPINKLSLRYGLEVLAENGDKERIVGNYVIYPPNSNELSWQAPNIVITAPNSANFSGSGADKVTISAELRERQIEESYRIGWFASAGKIKNRRALNSDWEELAGIREKTLIVTARGRSSGAFTYQALSYE